MYNLNNPNLNPNVKIAIEWANKAISVTNNGGVVVFNMYEGATQHEIEIIRSLIVSNSRVENCDINAQYAFIVLQGDIAKAA